MLRDFMIVDFGLSPSHAVPPPFFLPPLSLLPLPPTTNGWPHARKLADRRQQRQIGDAKETQMRREPRYVFYTFFFST